MTRSFRAIQITRQEEKQQAALATLTEADLMEGDVTVQVEYSALNYKDGLAITGRLPVVRRFPMIPGIDFAGTVLESDNQMFHPGDKVVLNGFGVGEVHCGGYSEVARVRGEWLVGLPEGLTARQAMAIGTAGYTSMLCVLALEKHGLRPESGDILVTGGAGGVGSVAVLLLAGLGYRVVAVTGRMNEEKFLKELGAAEVIERSGFAGKARPLGKELWAGAVDVAGGNTLANVLSQIRYGGGVAACGLAESMDLPTSVAPFILRGVTLYGIDSVMAPIDRRKEAWQRLVRDLDLAKLEALVAEIDLAGALASAEDILAGKVRGRTIVVPR